MQITNLLVTNSELALRLLVLVGESFEFPDGLRLQDLDAELDVALGVLVAGLETLLVNNGNRLRANCAYVYVGIIWQCRESLVQRLVHLLGIALEETSTA